MSNIVMGGSITRCMIKCLFRNTLRLLIINHLYFDTNMKIIWNVCFGIVRFGFGLG